MVVVDNVLQNIMAQCICTCTYCAIIVMDYIWLQEFDEDSVEK
jgi:hypothetical protein